MIIERINLVGLSSRHWSSVLLRGINRGRTEISISLPYSYRQCLTEYMDGEARMDVTFSV